MCSGISGAAFQESFWYSTIWKIISYAGIGRDEKNNCKVDKDLVQDGGPAFGEVA